MTTNAEKQKRAEQQAIIDLMIRIYCKGAKHQASNDDGLCPECHELALYARERNNACPLMQERTFCQFCPVHCYRPDMRERIAAVMRYSGPRMIFHRPVWAVRHLIEFRRQKRMQERQSKDAG